MATSTKHVELCQPRATDGLALRAIARASGWLDVNPAYAYALWVREFADTTVVARAGDQPIGYTSGFRRPGALNSLFIWQVAVLPEHRGERLGQRMLHNLADRDPTLLSLEATFAPDNHPSLATFARFADDRGASMSIEPLFDERHLGPGHPPEHLVRVAPLVATDSEATART